MIYKVFPNVDADKKPTTKRDEEFDGGWKNLCVIHKFDDDMMMSMLMECRNDKGYDGWLTLDNSIKVKSPSRWAPIFLGMLDERQATSDG